MSDREMRVILLQTIMESLDSIYDTIPGICGQFSKYGVKLGHHLRSKSLGIFLKVWQNKADVGLIP